MKSAINQSNLSNSFSRSNELSTCSRDDADLIFVPSTALTTIPINAFDRDLKRPLEKREYSLLIGVEKPPQRIVIRGFHARKPT